MTRIGRLTASAVPAQAAAPVSISTKPRSSPSIAAGATSATSDPSEQELPPVNGLSAGRRRIREDDEEAITDSRELSQTPMPERAGRPDLFRRASRSLTPDDAREYSSSSRSATQTAPIIQTKLAANGEGLSISSVSASAPVSKRARRDKEVSSEQQMTLDRMEKFFSRASQQVRPAVSREGSSTSTSSVEEVLSEDIDLIEDDPAEEEIGEANSSRTSIEIDGELRGDTRKETDEVILLDSPRDDAQIDVRREGTSLQSSEITFDLAALRNRLAKGRDKQQRPAPAASAQRVADELEEAGIKTQDEDARKALSRLVSKEDFAKMRVIGQFNLAFIIVRRREAIKREKDGNSGPLEYHDDLMIIE